MRKQGADIKVEINTRTGEQTDLDFPVPLSPITKNFKLATKSSAIVCYFNFMHNLLCCVAILSGLPCSVTHALQFARHVLVRFR